MDWSTLRPARFVINKEGFGLTLPVVVIEHIYISESNLGFLKAQVGKCAKEVSSIIDGNNEEYFELLKVKEVEFETEEKGVQVRHKELIIILSCKKRVANYSIYHELNNTVERRLRLSAYIFDEEGCVYPDKTARKTPLNVAKLRSMFVPNPKVTNPILKMKGREKKLDSKRSQDTRGASLKRSKWLKF